MEILHNKQDQFDNKNKCGKRSVRYLIYIALVSFLAFVLGYLLNPIFLRNIWLITSGTIIVICGIAIYILYSGTGNNSENSFCNQNCEL